MDFIIKTLRAFFLFADSRTVSCFSLFESHFVFSVLTTWLKTGNSLLTDPVTYLFNCLKSGGRGHKGVNRALQTRELTHNAASRVLYLRTWKDAAFGKMGWSIKFFLCINNSWL